MIDLLIVHIFQSTIFAGAVALLTVAFRKNRAQIRHWMWFSASIKFLIPFSLLLNLGSHIEWAPAVKVSKPAVALAMQQIARPFPADFSLTPHAGAITDGWITPFILALWAFGFAAIALVRVRDWRRIRAAVHASTPARIASTIEVRVTPGLLEPGVAGLIRPILLLPEGITERLTPSQLNAVLTHELSHVRRGDNLTSALHMIVETLFWFHPLVWWIGARLVDERERACDEEVLRLGNEPRAYAEGILNVCKLYVESPLACVSGITGSDLKQRIEAIMASRTGSRLSRTKKFMLAGAGVAALAGPIVIGLGNTSAMKAQSAPPVPLHFEVASIKPNNSGANTVDVRIAPGGRLWARNASLRILITSAYQIRDFQISGGPAWLGSARFDIETKNQGNPTETEVSQMLQTLLAERFQLKVHQETRDMPIYSLSIGKNGPKLQPGIGKDCFDPSTTGGPPPAPPPGQSMARPCGGFNMLSGRMAGAKVTMSRFAAVLSRYFGQTVMDKTGLDGTYDISLQWTPQETQALLRPGEPGATPADPSGPSIFTAIQEQLGLKLDSQKGPVEILVIDRAERPAEN
jgi:bla regulator protein BlaR1